MQKKGIKGFIISAIVLSLSLGIYQAFFAVTIAILLSVMLVRVLDGTTTSVVDYVKEANRRGGQTPHVLEEALSWHRRLLETGTMKKSR